MTQFLNQLQGDFLNQFILLESPDLKYTPKHGSWLNQAEIEIGLLSRQCLGTRGLPTLACLKEEARAWNATVNEARTKIDWHFSRWDARRIFGYNKYLSNRSQH